MFGIKSVQICDRCDNIGHVGKDCPFFTESAVDIHDQYNNIPSQISVEVIDGVWNINDRYYVKGSATSWGHNCLIDSLRQCLYIHEDINILSIRNKLRRLFCTSGEMQVTRSNFLSVDFHSQAIIDLLLQANFGTKASYHSAYTLSCIHVRGNFETSLGGCSIGTGLNTIFIAYVNSNHFEPFLPID